MYFIKKTFRIPVSHRLFKHLGRCNHNHGHNLKIVVELMAPELNTDDMIIDFSDLKEIVNTFLDRFDHSCLLNSNDDIEVEHCVKHNRRYVTFDDADPTAETLSKYLNLEIDNYLMNEYGEDDLCCYSVTVWENEDSAAKYIDDNNVEAFLDLQDNDEDLSPDDKTIKWINNNLSPDDIFEYSLLEEWAENNNFTSND